jgi:NTP pyrophosphatase (non-canonical NTP hydrolase)
MPLKDYQKDVDEWIKQFKDPYWPPLSQLAKLNEEVGELAQELNDRYGGRVKKSGEDTKDIGLEICDVFFALVCIANNLKIDLDEAWKKMMEKYQIRDNNRYERKEEENSQ